MTCNKVVDDSIGAFIRVHSSGDVPHHRAWRRVLKYRQLLVRQAAALEHTHTHARTNMVQTCNHIMIYLKAFFSLVV